MVRYGRLAGLFALFWLICLSLGYPTLNRYVPGDTSVSDAAYYADMVERGPVAVGEIGHWRYRILVPVLARPVYTLVKGHIGSWEPRYLALLVVNSAFCAGAAVITFVLGSMLTPTGLGPLVAALLLLTNFNVSNFYLSGLIDSAELFVMSLMFLLLVTGRVALLLPLGILAGLAKESTAPFMAAMAGGWYLAEWLRGRPFLRGGALAVAAVAVTLVTVFTVRGVISGGYVSPFGVVARPMDRTALTLLGDIAIIPFTRAFFYTFAALLPLSVLGLRRLPLPWAMCCASTFAGAMVLAGWAGMGDNVGRPLFSTTAAILTVAAALALERLLTGNKPQS